MEDTKKFNQERCLLRIKSLYPSLFEAEQRVADFVLSRPEDVINMSISQVADLSKVADSTVVRFCQDIGYRGFQEFKVNLAKDLVPIENRIHEDITVNDEVEVIAKKVFQSDMMAVEDTLRLLDFKEVKRAVDAIVNARRVEFYGVGSSGPIAIDGYYRFLQIGIRSSVATDSHIQAVSARMLTEEDVAVGISHTGNSKETVDALKYAKEAGAITICITSFARSPITKYSDICLLSASRETAFRTEAMASRIAQLSIIDTLFVAVAMKKFEETVVSMDRTQEVLQGKRF